MPSELAGHACLTLSRIADPDIWRFRVNDELASVRVKGPVSADSADLLVRLAIEGVGIVCLGELAVARAIQKGLLQLAKGFALDIPAPGLLEA